MDDALGVVFLFFVVLPVLFVAIIAIVAWPVMLFIGNASIASAGLVPALGYETVVWLTGAVAIATGGSNVRS